jgi:hypothetical protein
MPLILPRQPVIFNKAISKHRMTPAGKRSSLGRFGRRFHHLQRGQQARTSYRSAPVGHCKVLAKIVNHAQLISVQIAVTEREID